MISRDQNHEEEIGGSPGNKTELSIPWLMFGFALVVGYCVYYILS